MSLKTVTAHVRQHLEGCQRTTQTAVADAVLAIYRSAVPNGLPDESVRRRIYDVITVLRAIGYVHKSDSALVWVGEIAMNARSGGESEKVLRRVQSKEQLVHSKIRLFLHYSALISTNRTTRKPANALCFPMIVVGAVAWQVERREGSLAIESRVRPEVFSPIDILMCKPMDEDAVEGARRTIPGRPLIDRFMSD
jgi:hypothetical protein